MAELVAVAAIAAYGYYTSYAKAAGGREYADAIGPATYIDDADAGSNLRGAYEAAAARRWHASTMPAVTGIVRGNPAARARDLPVPHFKSGKAMNTRTEYKQRKLESFTGGDAAWTHKKVVEGMHAPERQGVVTSAGTIGNEPTADVTRTVQGKVMNNALPAEQIRVGPGLGVGPDVTSTGGFHQLYRQLPTNVNEHRLNTLPGRANHGANRVSKQAAPVNATVNRNPDALVGHYEDRPPVPTMAAVTARRADAEEARGHSYRRPYESDRYGIAGRALPAAPTGRGVDAPRTKPRGFVIEPPVVNSTATRTGVGGYVAGVNPQGLGTLRGQQTPNMGHAVTTVGATVARPFQGPGVTNRDLTGKNDHSGHAMASARADRIDVNMKQALGRSAKRVGQLFSHVNPAGRMNMVDKDHAGLHSARERPDYEGLERTHAKAPVQISNFDPGQRVRTGRKTEARSTLDLGLAAAQLASNPLAMDITHGGWVDRPLPQTMH